MTFIDEMALTLAGTICGYAVLAEDGTQVGSAYDLWPNYDGSGYSFLGVRTGWLIRRRHVVSADGMQIDRSQRQIHLPLTAQAIRACPCFEVTEVDAERAFKGPAAPVIVTTAAATSAEEQVANDASAEDVAASIELSPDALPPATAG